MSPDAFIEVRFKTTAEGGRNSAITGNIYSCPLFIDGEGFDCRIAVGNQTLELGEKYRLPVAFLCPDLARPKLVPGRPVTLWEGKSVAEGTVSDVVPKP